MGCCTSKKSSEKIKPAKTKEEIIREEKEARLKKEAVQSFDVQPIYDSRNPQNEMYQKLADSFKRNIEFSPSKAAQNNKAIVLPGPKSYKVPYQNIRGFQNNTPEDIWREYGSHKFLPINLVQEYIEERQHLPLPPLSAQPCMQEAFMAVNIMQDDPDYLIKNILLPAKERFI